jgi:hypothetical protein
MRDTGESGNIIEKMGGYPRVGQFVALSISLKANDVELAREAKKEGTPKDAGVSGNMIENTALGK